MRSVLLAPLLCVLLLAGCDMLGIESPEKMAAVKEADGKAVGSACRHAGRAIEDCYLLNPKAQRAAVFAGWREMDEYMRENKLDTIAPVTPPEAAKKPAAKSADDEIITETDDKPADKAADKKPAAARK